MELNKSEKILFSIFLLLSSLIIIYNVFYIPTLPNANIIKKEIVIQDNESEDNKILGAININSAKIDDLKKIPGVGEATAKKIIEYREQNGGFLSKEEIMNVSGIGKKKFENMKDYIKIKED